MKYNIVEFFILLAIMCIEILIWRKQVWFRLVKEDVTGLQ